jgi:uncharacterized iron-regulated membrane protein
MMSVETAEPRVGTRTQVVHRAAATERPKVALPPFKKLLFMFHGWLGLSLGLPLFVICLSGSFAVVSHEIDWLLHPAMRAPVHHGPVNWGAIAKNVRQRHPDDRIVWLMAPEGPGFAAQSWVQTPLGIHRVFADPATGEITGETVWFNSQRFFRDFHRRFFWYSAWAITLVCSFSFVLLFSAGTGLLFYSRWWAKLFTLRFHKGTRVFWSDMHRLIGVWTLLFAAIISITGLWYLFERPAMRWITGRTRSLSATSEAPATTSAQTRSASKATSVSGNAERRPGNSRLPELGPLPQLLPVTEYVRIAQEAYPSLNIRSLYFPERVGDPVQVQGDDTAWLVTHAANMVRIDPYRGTVVSVRKGEELSPGIRWSLTVDPLHFGNFGGLASKLIWFAFGLVLSGLMPTGLYLWLKRAEQTAAGVAKRLTGESTDQISQEVRHATRRWTGLGLIATTIVLGWSAVATYRALANEASKATREVTDQQAIGPWRVSAFREGVASAADKESTFGLRLSQARGHANFRQASLAVGEHPPEDSQWQIARGGLDERKAKLTLPTSMAGHKYLWVTMEAWDGSTYRTQFPLDTFRQNSGSHPTPRQSLGGLPVIFVFGAFIAFSMTIAVPWYWVVWFHRHRLGGGAANRAPRNTTTYA